MTAGHSEDLPTRSWAGRALWFVRDMFDALSGGGAAGLMIDQARSHHDRLQSLEARVARLEAPDGDRREADAPR